MAKLFIHTTFILLFFLQLTLPGPVAFGQTSNSQSTSVILAGMLVEIDLPFAVPEFIQPAPDDMLQVATAARWEPFFEVSLSAEPLTVGSSIADGSTIADDSTTANGSSTADVPTAQLTNLKTALQSLREEQSPSVLPGHTMSFFGQQAISSSNQVEIFLLPTDEEAVVIHEWAVQHDNSNWILRVSYTPGQSFDESLLKQIVVRAVGPAPEAAQTPVEPATIAALETPAGTPLPTPAWWQGSDCHDSYYYPRSSPKTHAFPLGGSYRGVKACGPRPWTGYKDVVVQFTPGAWGALEWQCVELSMRYLYLAYGIPTYSGNGKDVVANYRGTRLVKISNGSVNKAPVAGDVLSYGSTGVGHTSVVSASNVDAAGNGTITIIEQNNSATGVKVLTVSKWYVQASTTVSGWLHDPINITLYGPTHNVLVSRNVGIDLTWSSVPTATSYQVQFTGGPGVNEVGTTTTTMIVLSSGVPGGIYQWRVQAYKDNVAIGISEWRTIYRKYGMPGKLAVKQNTPTNATLTWAASSDAPNNIDGYYIYRNGGLIASTGPTTLTYTDGAAVDDACYGVAAYKGDLLSSSLGSCKTFMPSIAR